MPMALGLRNVVRAAVRVAAGLVSGGIALASRQLRAGRVARQPYAPRAPRGIANCLYLKPTLSFGASVGGSVAHVAGVANALARTGIVVRLLSAQEQPLVGPPCTQRVVSPRFLISFPFEVNSLRYESVFLRDAREEAARERPDFIYQRYALNDMCGVVLREELDVPLVLEFNGSEVWAQRHWGEPLRFERLAQRGRAGQPAPRRSRRGRFAAARRASGVARCRARACSFLPQRHRSRSSSIRPVSARRTAVRRARRWASRPTAISSPSSGPSGPGTARTCWPWPSVG